MNDLTVALKQLGLSQSALARLVDTVPGTVNRWCQGKRAAPHWLASWLAMYGMLTEDQRAAVASEDRADQRHGAAAQ